MSKSNVMRFPQKPCAADEKNTLWLVAVSAGFKDTYSCEYNFERKQWVIEVKSGTFQGAAAMVAQCRSTLGWDRIERAEA